MTPLKKNLKPSFKDCCNAALLVLQSPVSFTVSDPLCPIQNISSQYQSGEHGRAQEATGCLFCSETSCLAKMCIFLLNTQSELESATIEVAVLLALDWPNYSASEKGAVAPVSLSHNDSKRGGIESILQGCWWPEWILMLRNFTASLSASVGRRDPMRSQENPAPLSGPLWPIKDMERAYLKLQHTSPGQTNSLHTPSERPPGTDKYPPIGLRRE